MRASQRRRQYGLPDQVLFFDLLEEWLRFIIANRALVRGSSLLPDGPRPFFQGDRMQAESILQTIEGENPVSG